MQSGKSKNVQDFVEIPFEMIPKDLPLPCPIHLKIQDKFIIFRNEGDEITQERVDRLREKKVSVLYVRKIYWNFLVKTIEEKSESMEDSIEEKAIQTRNLIIAYERNLEQSFAKPRKMDFDKIRKACAELARAIFSSINLGALLMAKGEETSRLFISHAINVSLYSIMIGMELALPHRDLKNILLGGILHDIGKFYLPKDILMKGDKSTPEEDKEFMTHAEKGYKLLERVGLGGAVATMALQHHERFDGKGYPHGVVSERIHLNAKICSLADVFDNLTSFRPNWKPLIVNDAIQKMVRMEGCFDETILLAVTRHQAISKHLNKEAA